MIETFDIILEQFEIALMRKDYPSTRINGRLWVWEWHHGNVNYCQWKILFNFLKSLL